VSPRKKSKKKTSASKRTNSSKGGRRTNKAVDEVVTTTRVRTVPKIEVRRPGTLAQALTEPAVAVVKPQTRVVERRVRQTRRAA
jgi:hypothetical protein